MATNLHIDDKLILEAQKAGHFKSKRDAVSEALKEFVRRRKQRGIVELFGQVDYDPEYDYKEHRAR